MRKTIILNNTDLKRLEELKSYYESRDQEKKSYSETIKNAIYSEWLDYYEIPRRINENNDLPFN